jgi:ferredoxin
MRVHVEPARCAASGLCVLAAPEVFGQSDEDGTVELLDPTPASGLQPRVRAAAARCPARAISLGRPEPP